MLPQSHVAYTLAAFDAASDKIPELKNIDYRLLAITAMGPDLIDKPFAVAHFYPKYGSAVLFAHTLLAHAGLLLYALWKRPKWWPYAAAFIGHAVLDRLWFFDKTWYWPFKGWHFQVWNKAGSEQANIKLAYWQAFTRRPELWGWEVGGLAVGLWFVIRHRLYRPERLWHLLRAGRLPEA